MANVLRFTTGYSQSLVTGTGDDTLTSAFGSASLDGGAGNDSITAAGYGNLLLGGLGDDSLDGGAGNATLDGGAGANLLHAAGYNDSISAGDGNNTVSGTAGNASIMLGNGNNQLALAGWGNHVTTGSGQDSINLANGGGADILSGGGDDVIALGQGGGNSVDGGAGTDRVTYAGAASAYSVHVNGDGSVTVNGPGGSDTLRHVESLHFAGGGADVNLNALLHPAAVAPASTTVLFVANDGSHGTELWATDLTGTHMVVDLTPGAAGSTLLGLASLGGHAIFATQQVLPGLITETTIWATDGTAGGTYQLTRLDQFLGGWVGGFVPLGNGRALFNGWVGGDGKSVYSVDLSGAAPVVLSLAVSDTTPVATGNGTAFWETFGGTAVVYSDGTVAGTHSLANITGTGAFAALGDGSVVFAGALANSSNYQLWRFSGGSAQVLATINPGGDARISDLTSFGTGQVLFAADDGSHGEELWISDGTAAGTHLVADLYASPSIGGAWPSAIADLGTGKAVLFANTGGLFGASLVVTDGTATGTLTLATGILYSGPITALGNGRAIFESSTIGVPGQQTKLWVTDGTAAGTHLVDPAAAAFLSVPRDVLALGDGRAVFTAGDAAHGDEIWLTDGTAAGTTLLADIQAGAGGALPYGYVGIHATPATPRATTGYNQALAGTAGGDTLTSAFGNATLDGLAGNDSIAAAGYGNHLLGGAGDDSLDGGAGNASIDAGSGNNLVSVAGWGDSIAGGAGNDSITLANGGNAHVASGDGDDRISLGQGGGNSVDAGGGSDTVSYSGHAANYHVQRNADGSLTVSGPGGQDQLSHVELVQFSDGSFNPAAAVQGDLNGDGQADLVFQGLGQLWSWTMHGLTLGGAAYLGMAAPTLQLKGVGDFDGDGLTDLLLQDSGTGMVQLWTVQGGVVTGMHSLGTPGMDYDLRASGDLDHDGRTELLFDSDATGGLVYWQLNAGVRSAQGNMARPAEPFHLLIAGDFDGDGRTDLLFRNAVTNEVIDWQAQDLTHGSMLATFGTLDAAWQLRGSGDLDLDGRPDLLWRNASTGELRVWHMGGAQPQVGNLDNPGPWWDLKAVGDVDGDGRTDLVFQGQDGTIYAWQMNGEHIASQAWVGNPGTDWHLLGLG